MVMTTFPVVSPVGMTMISLSCIDEESVFVFMPGAKVLPLPVMLKIDPSVASR